MSKEHQNRPEEEEQGSESDLSMVEEMQIRHGVLRDHVGEVLTAFREDINIFKEIMHQDISSFRGHMEAVCMAEVDNAVDNWAKKLDTQMNTALKGMTSRIKEAEDHFQAMSTSLMSKLNILERKVSSLQPVSSASEPNLLLPGPAKSSYIALLLYPACTGNIHH